MKRSTAFGSLLWIPLLAAIVFFWSRHLSNGINPTALPLLERFGAMTPGALAAFVVALVVASAWSVFLWVRAREDRPWRLRPITIFFWWLVLVLLMGSSALGDIWQMPNVSITEAQRGYVLLREFGLTDPLLVNGFTMFGNMLRHVGIGLLSLAVLLLGALGFGTWVRRFFSETTITLSERLLLLLGAGFTAWVFLLTVLGLLGGLHWFIVTPLLLLTATLGLFREGPLLWSALTMPVLLGWKPRDGFLQPFFVVGLMLVLAASFLHVLRPIPIGWDDIGVYMNVPSLTAQHNGLVGGYGIYSWGLIMSLGFLVWNTPYVAMLYSFVGGLLAFFGLYVVQRHLLADKRSPLPLMLTTAFAMSPFVLFQLAEDMKVDLPLLFMGSVATLLTLLLWREKELRTWPLFALLGAVLGVALGIKLTAILLVIFVFGLLLLRFVGGWGLTALLGWSLFALFAGNIFAMGGLTIPADLRMLLMVLSGVGGLVATIKGYLDAPVRRDIVGGMLVTLLALVGVFAPWMIYNYSSWCTEGCSVPTTSTLLYSKSSQPLLPAQTQVSAGTGQVLQQELQTSGGTVAEELGRYAGYDDNIVHYLSLPFDASFSINVGGDYVTVGWVFLGLLLLAGAWGVTQYSEKRSFAVLFGFAALLVLVVCLGSLWGSPAVAPWVMHGVTIGVGLLLLAALVYGAHQYHTASPFQTWLRALLKKKDHGLRNAPLAVHLALMTVVYGFLWMYLASGVVWYGITVILGILALGAMVLERLRENDEGRTHYIVFVMLLTFFWVVPMYAYKLTTSATSIKQFEVSGDSLVSGFRAAQSYDTRHFILFKAGILNQDTALKFFNGEYYSAAQLLNKETESKIYRMGTLLPYFVQSNDTRMATDNQLDQFIATYLPAADPKAFVQGLYDAGFRYMVFDLGTDSIDRMTEKTLTKKVDIFQSFINNAPVGQVERDETGNRIFLQTNPLLKEELRASSFIIWSLHPLE